MSNKCRIGQESGSCKSSCTWARIMKVPPCNPLKSSVEFQPNTMIKHKPKKKAEYHYWVGNKSGLKWSHNKSYKPTCYIGEKIKYLGFTYDSTFPIKLNTGRVINERCFSKHENKKNKKKLS